MAKKTFALGPLGSKFFSLMQARHQTLIRQGELQSALGLTPAQEQTLLKRLAGKGFLLRLQRGIYLVPKTLPTRGFWRPNDYYIIHQYMKILNAKYYIGGLNAIYHHGLTEQIPNQFTVYNNKYSGKRSFGKLNISFIKNDSANIVGFESKSIPNCGSVNIATKAKTIIDLIQDWKRYHLIESAFEWLEQACNDSNFLKDFIQLAAKHTNNNTMRRIGYYLEKLGVSDRKLSLIKN
ncbi:MAG: DUF6088 family protein [Gammaproteobacteria bacterium]